MYMQLMKNINRASEFLFLVLGSIYLFAFLSWKNSFYPFETELFLRLADLPLLFFGILFGFTSLRISFIQKTYEESVRTTLNISDIITIILAFLFFGAIAYMDLFVPSITSLPIG